MKGLPMLALLLATAWSVRAAEPISESFERDKGVAQTTDYSEPAQPGPSDAVQRAIDQANRLYDTQNFEEGLKQMDSVLALAVQTHDSVGEVRAHRGRAIFLEALKRNEQAVSEWKQAAAGWERFGDGPGQVEALGRAAQLLLQNNPQQAEMLLNQALTLSRQERHRPLATSDVLDAVGKVMNRTKNLGWAKKIFEAALELRVRSVPDSLRVAQSLNRLGFVALGEGDLAAAKKYFLQALALAERLAPDSLAAADSLTGLGIASKRDGDKEATDEYFRKALEVAANMRTLGEKAEERKDSKTAENYYLSALEIEETLAPDSLDLALTVNALGNLAWVQGDLKTAEQYFKRAVLEWAKPEDLDKAEDIPNYFKNNVPESAGHERALEWLVKSFRLALGVKAAALRKLGILASEQDNLKAALDYHRGALAIYERLAPDSLDVANSLRYLGKVAHSEEDRKAALEYYEHALTIYKKLAPDSLDTATTLQGLGVVLRELGDVNTALDYTRQALAIREDLAPDSLDVASSLRELGIIAQDQGDLKVAFSYHRQALAIGEKLAPDSLNVADSLNELGLVAQDQGDLKAAFDYHRRALTIRERLAPDSLDVAASLHNLGIVSQMEGDLKAAFTYHSQALDIKEKLAPESLDMAQSLSELGLVLREEGDLKAAEEYTRRSLSIKEKLVPNSLAVAMSLSHLGSIARSQGDMQAAERYLKGALAIEEKLVPDSLNLAGSLTDLGTVFEMRGDMKAAREYDQRALIIHEKLAPDSLDLAGILVSLARVNMAEGELKSAEKYCLRALAIYERLAPESPAHASGLLNLALTSVGSGDYSSAEKLAEHAWSIFQHQSETLTSDEARLAFGSSIQGVANLLIALNLQLGEHEKAFLILEAARSRALTQLLFEKHEIFDRAGKDLWLRHQEALARLHHAEESLTKSENIRERSQAVEKQTDDARKEYQRARDVVDHLWAEIHEYMPRAFVPVLNLSEAQSALRTGEVFVAFALQGDIAFVFLLTDTGPPKLLVETVNLAPTGKGAALNGVNARILGFWDLLHTPPSGVNDSSREEVSRLATTGRQLFDALFPGEIGKLVLRSKRVILSPDGVLWQLPFAALVTDLDQNGNPHYLGEQVAIAYTPGLSLYAEVRRQVPPLAKGITPKVLAVGNPNFGRKVEPDPSYPQAERLWAGLYKGGIRPSPLPSTAREAQVIAGFYGGTPLTGDAATELAIRKQIENADVIHFATHGELQTAVPMSSGILLTPPDRQPGNGETNNDGILQAWEIFSQLKLRAELVVLSACDTARGDIVRGEGVVGLTRALEYAGARSVVATQWSVPAGESTTELMEDFHRDLRAGMAKDEALKDAMAVVRKKYRHPYFWASFILMGNPDNPNLSRN